MVEADMVEAVFTEAAPTLQAVASEVADSAVTAGLDRESRLAWLPAQ
jgi:hypothetical protein